MAVDAMDIDSSPVTTVPETDKERKRKHKTKEKDAPASSPSKKKRKHESTADDKKPKKSKSKDKETSKSKSKTTTDSSATPSKSTSKSTSTPKDEANDSPYVMTTATLYLPLSPISISPTHALNSLLAEHLSPLLLTYYPPLQGVIMAYSHASISSTPPPAPATSPDSALNPQPLTLARTAGEYGVLYVYLTATFLVFRPQRGHILEGWVNVQSEGFLGAVSLNLFSVGIERKRLPSNWKWVPPGEEQEGYETNDTDKPDDSSDSDASAPFDAEKEHFNPVPLASDSNPLAGEEDYTAAGAEDEDLLAEGYFRSVSGHRVRGTVRFRVVDIDIIPGADKDRGFISIEGTMLTPEEEAQTLEDERNGVMSVSSFATPWVAMSGAREPDTPAVVEIQTQTPSKSTEAKPEKEKKGKRSKKSSKEKKEK